MNHPNLSAHGIHAFIFAAQEPPDQIHVVNTRMREQLAPLRISLCAQRRAVALGGDIDDLAQASGTDGLIGLFVTDVKAADMRHHDLFFIVEARIPKPARAFQRIGQRLLDENVLLMLDRL